MKIIITGTSTGIGRALAEHLLARGHHIWGLARSDQNELVTLHPQCFFASRCDVSNWQQLQDTISRNQPGWAQADALITCAGIQGEIGPAVTADPLNWSTTVRANLDGTYFTIRGFYEMLTRSANRAKIICFSGGGATKARPNFSAYGVAKAGIVRLVETIGEELQGLSVDINAVAPGAINTRLTDEVIARGPELSGKNEYDAALKQKSKGGSSIDKALGLVEWLLSKESDGLTGRLLSAPWDPWTKFDRNKLETLSKTDVYMLRRIVPEDRSLNLD